MFVLLSGVLILAGLEGSYGLGELPRAAVLQAAYGHVLGDIRLSGTTSDKSESGKGYILGLDADFHPRIGPLVGVGWRYRDGGNWVKRSLWLRGGIAINRVTAVLAWDVTSDNRVRLGELRTRWSLKHLQFEPRVGLAHYDGFKWGGLASMSIGYRF